MADFNFYLKHYNSFDYTAIAGDKEFKKEMVKILDRLMPGKAKYFNISDLEKAKEWVKQK